MRRAAPGPAPRKPRSWDQGHLSRSGRGRLCRSAFLYRRDKLFDCAAKMRLASATNAMSRPAPNSGPTFSCTRPPGLQGGPTAAYFCRSPPTTPRICRCQGQKEPVLVIIKACTSGGDFRRAHRAFRRRGFASISRAGLGPRACSAGSPLSPKRHLRKFFGHAHSA